MALRPVCLVLLLPLTLVNGCWASMLGDNVLCIAGQDDGLCGGMAGIAVPGLVLPGCSWRWALQPRFWDCMCFTSRFGSACRSWELAIAAVLDCSGPFRR